MVVIARKIPKFKKSTIKYALPEFNKQRLLDHIQQLVDNAPYGVVGLVIDLFCGAGGTSEGLEQALAKNGHKGYCIIAGINHDIKAIYSQAKNHPLAYYSTEDIRTARLEFIKELIDECRQRWPQCPILIWASLECTNLSNAKGGMSRDADSRTLAWHIFRYLEMLKPDGLWIENVKEFAQWGPMMEKVMMVKGKKKITLAKEVDPDKEMEFYREYINQGYTCFCPLDKKKKAKKLKKGETPPPLEMLPPIWVPIKHLKGTYYHPWVDKVKAYGYHYADWLLNAADYGVPQSRERFFPMFMNHGYQIIRPEPTHAKNASNDLFSNLQTHVPVKTCLDLDEEGESIFTPGKIKSDKSFERYYAGLIKFVAGGKKNFMLQRNSGNPIAKVYPVEGTARTVTTTGGNQEVVSAYFLAKHNSSPKGGVNAGSSIANPCPALTCKSTARLMEAEFLTKHLSNDPKTGINAGASINKACPTVSTQGRLYLTQAQFLDVIYGNGTPYSIDRSSPTVRTKDGLALMSPNFLINYQGQSKANSVDESSPTIMTKDKLYLGSIQYFIINQYSGGGQLDSIDKTAAAVTTIPKGQIIELEPLIAESKDVKKNVMLFNCYHGQMNVSSIDKASPTVIARQDKSPLSILISEEGWVAIPVYKTDSEIVVKIKEFMAMYGIADIKTRALMVKELLKIQSFPENYYLADGTTDQKKWIGNAVPPLLARKIAEAMHESLVTYMVQKLKLAA